MLIVLCFSFAEMYSKFTKFNTAEWDYQARYDILKTRPEETPKQMCLDTLEVVGQLDRYNTLVTGPLRVALGTRLHAVLSIAWSSTVLSRSTQKLSHSMKKEFSSDVRERCFQFLLHSLECKWVCSPRKSPVKRRTRVVYVNSQLTWARQCGLKSGMVHMIQVVLSNSLSQRRDNTGVVNLRDLTILYYIHNHVPLDVTHLLLRNMHLNQLASSPTPIFFGGWIYRLFKTYVHLMSKSFRKGPWSGKVDLTQCRSMGIIHETGDGTVRFQTTQGHVWNPEEALVLHPNRPPPQYQGHQTGSSSQGSGFLTFKVT
ncbi:hypothetical protein Hanom_Chr16g01445351 [Helianthus anomalus]